MSVSFGQRLVDGQILDDDPEAETHGFGMRNQYEDNLVEAVDLHQRIRDLPKDLKALLFELAGGSKRSQKG